MAYYDGNYRRKTSFWSKDEKRDQKRDIDGVWKHDMYELMEKQEAHSQHEERQPARLFISNLHYDVNETDLIDIFSSVGRVQKAAIHFDNSGRSLGTANLCFEREEDAIEAFKQYNRSILDGKEMEIELFRSPIDKRHSAKDKMTVRYNRGEVKTSAKSNKKDFVNLLNISDFMNLDKQ